MDRMTVPMHDLSMVGAPTAWADILTSGRYLRGPYADRFASEWARFCSARECVPLASGYDALELTLRAMYVGMWKLRVLLPALTAPPVWRAVVNAGGIPVGIDCNPDGSMNLAHLEACLGAAITESGSVPSAPVVLAVWLYGNVTGRAGVWRLCDRYNVRLLEDCSHAHGIQAGKFPMVFSFYPTKNLAALGDAGALVTDDGWLSSAVARLADYAREGGRTSRMDELQAAVLLNRLEQLPEETIRRRGRAGRYHWLFREWPPKQTDYSGDVHPGDSFWHQYVIRHPHRDALRIFLSERGVETGVHYYPIPPVDFALPFDAPHAVTLSEQVLSLPIGPHVTSEMQDYIVQQIGEFDGN